MAIQRAVILHTSDLHGHVTPFAHRRGEHVGGLAHLITAVREVRASHPGVPVIWADCGDSLANGLLSDLTRGRCIIEAMGRNGLDALVIGNHEFDHPWGREGIREAAEGATFPFLAANLRDQGGRLMPGVAESTMFSRGGLGVAIVGMTTPDAEETALRENIVGLSFEPIEVRLPKVEREIPDWCEVGILAVHAGPEVVREAALRSARPWVIVGGHTDEPIVEPLWMGNSVFVKGTSYGEHLGVLEVGLEDGRIAECRHRLVAIGPSYQPADPETMARIEAEHEALTPLLEEEIAHTHIDLLRNDEGESLLDNLILDAIRALAPIDIAVRNSTATRADILRGVIRVGHLYAAIPWDEPIEYGVLQLDHMVAALEHSVGTTADPHVLQVSGARVCYDMRRPLGRRVRDLLLDDGRALVRDGELSSHVDTITVALRPFLLQGGLGYEVFRECTERRQGPVLREIVRDYLRLRSRVESVSTGRLRFEGRD